MLKKSSLSLFSLAFITLSACSGGGGGGGINRDLPEPLGSISPVGNTATPAPDRILTPPDKIEIPGKEKFQEPLTKEEVPSPASQMQSFQKIMGALAINDFDYVDKEYDLGGIKRAAFQVDTEFPDLKLDYSAKTIARNSGIIGYESRNVTALNSEEKKIILDKILKQVFIFTIRGNANRLIENNKSGISGDDKFSTEIAGNMFTYFNGSDSGTITEHSVARMAQAVDTGSNLTSKAYNSIASALNATRAAAKADLTTLNAAKRQVDIAFYKMLYFSVLENMAAAEDFYNKKDMGTALNHISASEFIFLGIRDAVQTNNGTDNTMLNKIVSNRRFSFLDYARFEALLNYGFGQRIIEEMLAAIRNISADNAEARNAALGAQLYIDIIASAYNNGKHQRTENTQLKTDIQGFRNAVQNKNVAQAQQLFDKIRPFVTKPAG